MPIFINRDFYKFSPLFGKVKMSGILDEALKKRIKCIPVTSKSDLLCKATSYDEPSSLVLFISSYNELEETKKEYDGISMPIIIFSHIIYDTFSTDFSYIMSDVAGAMRQAVTHLNEQGASRLALFSVNYESNYDRCRADTFTHVTKNESPIIFTRTAGFKDCVKKLLSYEGKIDGLLCTNDFEAMRLMRVLSALDKDWNSKMLILGFTDTTLSALHPRSLTSTSLNYFAGGKEVVSLHLHLANNPEISHSQTIMKSKLEKRTSTSVKNPCGFCFADRTPPSDEELDKLLLFSDRFMTLESIISESSDTILKLLLYVLEDKTINKMADELYFSRDNVLYHLRRIRKLLNVNSTKELRELLSRWIDANAFRDYIEK